MLLESILIKLLIPTGLYSGWIVALQVNLSHLGFRESTAARIGAASLIGSCLTGVSFSLLADRLGGRLKVVLVGMTAAAGFCFLLFSLQCAKLIPFNLSCVFASSTLAGALLSGTTPLFYEFAARTGKMRLLD